MKYMKKGGRSFPDLNRDGKITMADILQGRGVIRGKGKKKRAARGMYVPPGNQMGVGGAILQFGKNIAEGKKLGSGLLKGVGRAAVTPGSAVGAGAGLVGALAGKSKNPAIQKIGKGIAGVGQIAGMFTGGGGAGGGILQKAGNLLKGGGQGAGGGMLKNIAGNVLGGGAGGGAGAGILQNLAGNLFSGKDGMKVSYADGGKMSYGDGGSMMEGRKPMLIIKMENGGGIGDPVPADAGDDTYGEPRIIKTQTTSGEFQEDKPLTGGDYVTTIGAINPEGGSLDALDDDKKSAILGSQFGQTYLSGEGSLDDQYKAYQTKVFDFIDNNPKEALSRINEMMETNEGFQTKLTNQDGSEKSDEEKLSITRQMMTDGKIGDFHGTILTNPEKTPLPQFYSPQTSNIRTYDDSPSILVGTGMRSVKPNQMGEYLAAAEEAGISREELSKDTEKTRDFLNKYLDEHGSQQSSPSAGFESGTSTGGYSQYFIDEAKEGAEAGLKARSDQAKEKRTTLYRGMNEAFDQQLQGYEDLEAFNEQFGTKFKNPKDIQRLEERISELSPELQAIAKGPQKGRGYDFMEQYLKETGGDINNPKDRREANDEYHRVMFSEIRLPSGEYRYKRMGQGGKMTILKGGGKSYLGGGALSSLIR